MGDLVAGQIAAVANPLWYLTPPPGAVIETVSRLATVDVPPAIAGRPRILHRINVGLEQIYVLRSVHFCWQEGDMGGPYYALQRDTQINIGLNVPPTSCGPNNVILGGFPVKGLIYPQRFKNQNMTTVAGMTYFFSQPAGVFDGPLVIGSGQTAVIYTGIPASAQPTFLCVYYLFLFGWFMSDTEKIWRNIS